ncbi:MAG: 23S rRNA (guanosine(2251)-2'-O)-methyltransferase RlmB [Rickettsiaceae bacterium]|nr:23S rRNA (guanosine(2251)-2'-O)-methyltransferase RlmB [Rickettsiaceae bacterium]
MKKISSPKYYIYGKHASVSAFENLNRKIHKIFTSNENKNLVPKNLLDKLEIIAPEQFAKILPKGAVHQNIALETSLLHTKSIEQVTFQEKTTLVILDQVTDPQNIGAVLRNAASFGIDGIILPNDNSPHENGIIAKAASGALELVDIYRVTNLVKTMNYLKKLGFWITGLDGSAKDVFEPETLSQKTCLVLGAEGAGIRRLVLENCDMLAKIMIDKKMESLNVASASAITFYEISKSLVKKK